MSKVISILSYLGFLWVIAFILKKTQNEVDTSTRIHLEQGFGLFLIGTISLIIGRFFPEIWAIPGTIVSFAVFVFLVLGIINVITDKNQPLPLIGGLFSGKFPFLN